jgi:hypothetical protein
MTGLTGQFFVGTVQGKLGIHRVIKAAFLPAVVIVAILAFNTVFPLV